MDVFLNLSKNPITVERGKRYSLSRAIADSWSREQVHCSIAARTEIIPNSSEYMQQNLIRSPYGFHIQ